MPLQSIISTLPDLPNFHICSLPRESWFLLNEIPEVGQQLVELIKKEVVCDQALIYAHSYPEERVYLHAASGLTSEQIHRRCKTAGLYTMSEFLDPDPIALLRAGQLVILPRSQIHVPPEFEHDLGEQTMLLAPLFAKDYLVGLLVVSRTTQEECYSPRDIDLVKATANLVVIVLERVLAMHSWVKEHASVLALEEVNRRTNEFLNTISHELNTPLTSLIGNIQLAQLRLQRWRRDYADQPNLLKRIDDLQKVLYSAWEGAHKQKHLISHMVDDAQLQSGNLVLRKHTCNLADIARDTVATIQRNHPYHLICLTFIDKVPNYPIYADSERIEEVLHTFINNALAYSAREEPVNVMVRKDNANVYVSVQDRGPGISPEDQPHIWERFYRSKGVGVQHELDLSLGLSLYLCRCLIELHQGMVGLESAPGSGSTFWFSVPLARGA